MTKEANMYDLNTFCRNYVRSIKSNLFLSALATVPRIAFLLWLWKPLLIVEAIGWIVLAIVWFQMDREEEDTNYWTINDKLVTFDNESDRFNHQQLDRRLVTKEELDARIAQWTEEYGLAREMDQVEWINGEKVHNRVWIFWGGYAIKWVMYRS